MYYLIYYTLFNVLNTQFRQNNHRSLISPLSLRTVFSDLVLWRHHSWSLTSRECRTLAPWRHIHLLFLHAQIGAKAIFTSEWQPWISLSHHPVCTACLCYLEYMFVLTKLISCSHILQGGCVSTGPTIIITTANYNKANTRPWILGGIVYFHAMYIARNRSYKLSVGACLAL